MNRLAHGAASALLSVAILASAQAADRHRPPPLVYDAENTGAHFPAPAFRSEAGLAFPPASRSPVWAILVAASRSASPPRLACCFPPESRLG